MIENTVHGSRPKVDLVWIDGRLVVELDGYPDHASATGLHRRPARDYELALSGYTVLRLANDEVVQDFGRAIEKIARPRAPAPVANESGGVKVGKGNRSTPGNEI